MSANRVFLQFSFRQFWFCEFLEEDRKTRLPGTAMLPDERKLFELVSAVVSPEHFRAPGDRGRDQEETRRCLAGAHAGAVCKAAATSGKLDKITLHPSRTTSFGFLLSRKAIKRECLR